MKNLSDKVGSMPETVIIDSGFASKTNIIKLIKKGVQLIGPLLPQSTSAGQFNKRGVDPDFRTEAFVFKEAENSYLCPANKRLPYIFTKNGRVSLEHIYRASKQDCQDCSFKEKCLGNSSRERRTIVRREDVPAVQEFIARMNTQEAKEIYKQRSYRMEFVFAWLKEKFGLRKFRLRGQSKVEIELLWNSLAFNIQRLISLRAQRPVV